MRLLHTRTGRFHTFDDPRYVRYAILSHVWARPSDAHYPELSFEDVRRKQDAQDVQDRKSLASGAIVSVVPQFTEKIRRFCEIALEHHYEYAWADGCCIDQSSSSELSEAINSMYDWYRYADVCYAYLHDVSTAAATTAELEATGSAFRKSRWHRRGWTLQELLAPTVVVFLSKEWDVIGSKHTLADLIQSVTGIDRDVLTFQRPLESFSVACRMSWAASRETSKEEDAAYSLMGIFGVNMPTIYGEGGYAFIRLQEEILKHIPDQTIFAWGPVLEEHNFAFHHPNTYRASSDILKMFSVTTSSAHQYLLASSPRDFRYSSNLVSIKWDEFMRLLGAPLEDRPTYMTTSYGVRTRLPILSVRARHPQTNVPTCVALLACKDVSGSLVALLLRAQPRRPEVDYFVGAVVGQLGEVMGSIDTINPFSMTPDFSQYYFRTTTLRTNDLSLCRERFHPMDIYIPYRPSLVSHSLQRDAPLHSGLRSIPSDLFDLRVSPWSQELLKLDGYHIMHHPGRNPFSVDIVHAQEKETISVYVGRCNCQFGETERFLNIDVCTDRSERLGIAFPTAAAPHKKNHEGHIQSWTFRSGAASKEFNLRQRGDRRVTVRLTLTKSTESSHAYVLGIEVWKTREEEVERERRRIKSMVTGKRDDAPKDAVPRRLDTRMDAAPALVRTRSRSHPPPGSAIATPSVAGSPLDALQFSGFYTPMESPTNAGSSLITPPMSRNASLNNGVVDNHWRMSASDVESWHGIGYQRSDDYDSIMQVDPPTPSPAGSQTAEFPSVPHMPHRPITLPKITTARGRPTVPRKAFSLDGPPPSPAPRSPSFYIDTETEGGELLADEYHTHRRPRPSEKRQTFPEHLQQAFLDPSWSPRSAPPFRGPLAPESSNEGTLAQQRAQYPRRDTDGDAIETPEAAATPKTTGKRRLQLDTPASLPKVSRLASVPKRNSPMDKLLGALRGKKFKKIVPKRQAHLEASTSADGDAPAQPPASLVPSGVQISSRDRVKNGGGKGLVEPQSEPDPEQEERPAKRRKT